ncbi:hypothetical protein GCM10022393_42810 [Aquimarina addita]|uniref:Uncharacterized protein n=1 Tax=Aquimarina addita TaxID=870485 RepID=A0ABP6UY63_9FLAO
MSKAKSIRFSDLVNIHRPFDLAETPALRLGIVTKRFLHSLGTFYYTFLAGPSAQQLLSSEVHLHWQAKNSIRIIRNYRNYFKNTVVEGVKTNRQ